MAASAATASSSEDGSVTVSAACCAYVLTQLPLPGLPGRHAVAVPYVLTARTWQLWHMFRGRLGARVREVRIRPDRE